MTGHVLLLILIYYFHAVTSALPEPTFTVSQSEITETDSVTLNCEAPTSVTVSHCYFYTINGGTITESSCSQTMRGTELLEMAKSSSPVEVKMTCYYMIKNEEVKSPYSDRASIMIQIPPEPELTVSPSVITETDSVTLNCQTPPSVSGSLCYFYTKSGGIIREASCLFTLTGSELLYMAKLSSPSEVKASCAYRAKSLSPYSDPSTISIQTTITERSISSFQTPVETTTGVNKEELKTDSTSSDPSDISPEDRDKKDSWIQLVVVTAACGVSVCVIFIIGCVFLKRKQNPAADSVVPNSHETQNSDIYHFYHTVSDDSSALVWDNILYSSVSTH